MLSINTNLSSLIAQSSMKQSTAKLDLAVERLSTGYKIIHAKDNAANYSISTNMDTKLRAYDVAADNVAMGMELVTTASDTISLMQDKAERLRALSTQARNGTYGAQSLGAINSEANAIITEINRIYSMAKYNGISLFTSDTVTLKETPTVAMFALPRASAASMFIEDSVTYKDQTYVDNLTAVSDCGGSFTEDEYKIADIDDLKELARLTNLGVDTSGTTFILANDIDIGEYCDANLGAGGWTPIGIFSKAFKGSFDGNGHVIKNLKINQSTGQGIGLFGYTSDGSEIKNLGLEGGSVIGKSSVGSLVGSSHSSITNCYATCDVSGSGTSIGGLIGSSSASITNSYATGTVEGYSTVGGLVGGLSASFSITNSYATGDVTGTKDYIGGLVGNCWDSTFITSSYATGNVTSTGNNIGGLAGGSPDSITNCYATGIVSGSSYVGGLVGTTSASTDSITSSYATGNVTATGNNVGGLAGVSPSSITNSYAMGDVTSTGNYVGGLAGVLHSSITNSYATGNVIGNGSSVAGLVGYSSSSSSIINSAAVQTDPKAVLMTEDGIKTVYTHNSMGFTEDNGWTIVNDTPLLSWQRETQPAAPSPDTGSDDSSEDLSYDKRTFLLQVGVNSNSSCQIGFDTNFSFDLSAIGNDISTDEALATIDNFLNLLSEKQTMLGAVQNRLESALNSITVNIENLTSSHSTIRDADIAETSSEYIKQQILQQAAATLMSTANQSPAIALQLI